MRQKILVLGNADMDITMSCTRIPEQGETVTDNGGVTVNPSGRGASCAIAMARMDAKTVYCARVGDDGYGKRLARLCSESRVDLSHLEIDRELRTGVSLTMQEENGESRNIYFMGANANLSQKSIKDAFACEPEAVLSSTDFSSETLEMIASAADFMAAPLILCAKTYVNEISFKDVTPIEIFIASDEAVCGMTDVFPIGSASCLRAVLELQKSVKATYYVINLGDKGAFIYDGKYYHMISPYAVKTLDNAGSFDVFTAALTIEYIRNKKDIVSACKYASAASALSLLKAGTVNSMPHHADVLEFIAKYN